MLGFNSFVNGKYILKSLTDRQVYRQLKILSHLHSQKRLEDAYKAVKAKCQSKKLPKDVNPRAVFACNELDLKEVKVYGFDYDYTLACYKPSLDYLLYNLGRQTLIEQYKYPQEISSLEYKPGFAVRGLHYDIEKGVLLKLDSFLQIQFGSVYKGLKPLSNEEVLQLYKNRIIPIAYVEGHTKYASVPRITIGKLNFRHLDMVLTKILASIIQHTPVTEIQSILCTSTVFINVKWPDFE